MSCIDEIRQALASEIDAVGFPFIGDRSLDEYLEKIDAAAEIVTWMCGGDLVAFVAYYANDVTRERAFISMLWVSSRHRGRSLGAVLLRHVISVCRMRMFGRIALNVHRDNEVARKFYLKEGFAVVRESGEIVEMERRIA